jgi:transcriptional regulator with XRE-family HTH domain
MSRAEFRERYEELRQHLIEARTNLGLTQAQVAKRLRRPQSFVSKYERGERRLDVIEFLEVADVLHINVTSLLKRLRR